MIPVIHTTDLHHSPNDPDDHFDLAAVYALTEFDLRAIILDYTEEAFGTTIYEPGYTPVTQLNFLSGRGVPAAVGPTQKSCLENPEDALLRCSRQEQAGIRLLLKALAESPTPAYITVTGSCRAVAAAFNREPELVREKTRAIMLVAGSARNGRDDKHCYNQKLDRFAYQRIWESGLPIRWLPCVGNSGYPNYQAPNNGHFLVSYKTLLHGLDDRLLNYFLHGLWGNMRGDVIRSLYEANRYEIFREQTTHGTRNIFCLGGFILMAERELVKTDQGWRFLPRGQADAHLLRSSMRWVPIETTFTGDAHVHFTPCDESRVQLFERETSSVHAEAMGEAFNDLLRSFPV